MTLPLTATKPRWRKTCDIEYVMNDDQPVTRATPDPLPVCATGSDEPAYYTWDDLRAAIRREEPNRDHQPNRS